MKLSKSAKALVVVAAAAALFVVASWNNSPAMNKSTANVKHITQGEFESEVAHGTNAVVADFYATWCGPCRMLSPMLDRLAGSYTNRVRFVKINVDESSDLAQKFQVEAIPTLIFFRDGKVANRITGLPDESVLKSKLDAFAAGG